MIVVYLKSEALNRVKSFCLTSKLCTYQRKAGEAGHVVGIWLSLSALEWGIWLILFSQDRGYLNLSPPDVRIFDCRLGRKRLWPNICFPLPRFTHAHYGLERSWNRGGQRKQAKGDWILLFCLQTLFALACFWSIEPCKILWYQSKRK